MSFKYEAVDIIKLHNKSSHDLWNRWLTYSFESQDVEGLKKIRYGLARGMDNAVKEKLNTEEIVNLFIRLNRSIEITLKRILKEKYPSPNDNPLTADKYDLANLSIKRLRDQEFDKFLKESSF
jgi:hypothetical protein